jgi:flagellar basal-body rod protein FlgB
MIRSIIFDQSHLADLKVALDVYAKRHRVVAENIANVQTPGYRAREFRFEEELAGAQTRMRGRRTHVNHLPVGRQRLTETAGQEREAAGDYDNGVNSVDVDGEMATLATNDLSFRLATRLLSMKYNLLRGAIKGQVK